MREKTDRPSVRPSPAGLLPIAGLAAASLGLWMLWPLNGGGTDRAPAPVSGLTRYSVRMLEGDRPALIPLPSHSFSVSARNESPDQDDSLSPSWTGIANLLKWSPGAVEIDSGVFACAISTPYIPQVRVYDPVPDPLSPAGRDRPVTQFTVVSENLKLRSFELAQCTSNELPCTAGRWFVNAQIDIGTNGRVERVFLVAPSTNIPVNDAVIRRLYEGRGNPAGEPCSGFVTIGWPGIEKGTPEP